MKSIITNYQFVIDCLQDVEEIEEVMYPKLTTHEEVKNQIHEWATDPNGEYRNVNLWDSLGWTASEYVYYVKTGELPDG